MLMRIQHRGPDESGIYLNQNIGLGHVRLSILDLKTGSQPMSDENGLYWIIFNGEIFNYIELREELKGLGYQFRTGSDTEVLLLLFKHFREKCLEKLNGQFAFAVWDSIRKELFMARDRVGIRPLFYYNSGDTFVFSSEIKCILETGAVQAEVDTEALDRAFTFWSIPSPGTMFKGIYELPPGHYMIMGKDSPVIHSYWDLNFGSQSHKGGTRSL